MENQLKHSREFNNRHLQKIESLETENEALHEELNKKQKLIDKLTEQVNRYQRVAAGLSTNTPGMIDSWDSRSISSNQSKPKGKSRSATENQRSLILNQIEKLKTQSNPDPEIPDSGALNSRFDEVVYIHIENIREKVNMMTLYLDIRNEYISICS